MANRNYIDEITDLKKRLLKKGSRYDLYAKRFHPLIDVATGIAGTTDRDRELWRYTFVGLVACLEGFFRLAIKDLIDKSNECKENIRAIKDIKYDVDTVLAIHSKTVSIGEFISHLVPLSSFESLNRNMSLILGLDFMGELKNIELVKKKFPKETRRLPSDTAKWLKELYRLRNIYCHELSPRKESVKALQKKSIRCFRSCSDIVLFSEVYFRKYFDK